MNHRDLALAAMLGQPVNHIPFIARMDLWYSFHRNRGTLPRPYENAELWDIQRDLGIGIFGFGVWGESFYRTEYTGVEVGRYSVGGLQTTEYRTPYGILTCRDLMTEELHEAAGAGARIEYPFKSESDYDALQYLFDHTAVVDNCDSYARFVDAIGEDGVALPFSGHLPAHQLMIHYMGYEKFYCELFDHEDRIDRLLQSLDRQYQEILALAVGCSARAIEVGGNYDEQMTPPPIFEKFFAPFYPKAKDILEKAGKVLVIHGDGEMKSLLSSVMDCGVQVVEALTPAPMTSIDITRVRELWKDRVAVWGGLPSIILTETFSDDDFEKHLYGLFNAITPGDRFILGFGDNVPTDAKFERVKRIAQFWTEKGKYPQEKLK